MDIIYVSDQICQKGLSNNAMKIMGFFTNMNTEYKDMDKLSEKDSIKLRNEHECCN